MAIYPKQLRFLLGSSLQQTSAPPCGALDRFRKFGLGRLAIKKLCPVSRVSHSANTSAGSPFFPNRASRPANKYVNMYYIYSHRRRTEVITAKQRSWPAPFKSGYLISPFCYVERIVASQAEHLGTDGTFFKFQSGSMIGPFCSALFLVCFTRNGDFLPLQLQFFDFFPTNRVTLFPGILGGNERRPLMQQEVWYLIFRHKFMRCLNQHFF